MRRQQRPPIQSLRQAIDCLPLYTRVAMLEGVRSNDIIVGAYVDRRGGVCPMLAAHRCGGRTDFLTFARSWDRFATTKRARRAPALQRLFRGFVLAGGEAGVPRDLAPIRVPTLVVHGEQDRIISKRVAEDLVSALPRAELVVMRGVGHSPQLEAPRPLAKLVESFVRRIERAR